MTSSAALWYIVRYNLYESFPSADQGEPAVSYRWTGGVWDFRRITYQFWKIYRIHLKWVKQNRKMSTWNRLDLEALGSWPTTVLPLWYDTFGKHKRRKRKKVVLSRCRRLINMKWHKVFVLLREYENISNMSLKCTCNKV